MHSVTSAQNGCDEIVDGKSICDYFSSNLITFTWNIFNTYAIDLCAGSKEIENKWLISSQQPKMHTRLTDDHYESINLA